MRSARWGASDARREDRARRVGRECMASAAVDDRPLTADMLAAHLAEGCKPESQFRIGAEHEKFVFRLGSHAPVPYEPPKSEKGGIKALLEGLMAYGWQGVYEGETLIALERGKANV